MVLKMVSKCRSAYKGSGKIKKKKQILKIYLSLVSISQEPQEKNLNFRISL